MLGRCLCTLSKDWHWQPEESKAAEETKAEEEEKKWYQTAGEASGSGSASSAAGSVDVKKESSEEDGVAKDYRVLRFMVYIVSGLRCEVVT